MTQVWSPEATRGAKAPFLIRHHYTLIAVFLAVSALVAFGPRPAGLDVSGQRAIGIFFLCAAFWVTGVIPLQITSIIAIALLPILDIMPSHEAFALFGNRAVFFILGAFIISAVLVECGLSTRLTCMVLGRFGATPKQLRTTILLFSAFASFWMSSHAVAAMAFPIVMGIVKAMGLKPGEGKFGMSYFFALAWGCVIGGIATYLGGARNPLAMGILFEETGVRVSFAGWLAASLPLVILLLAAALIVLHFGYPEEPVDMEAARRVLKKKRADLGPMTRVEMGVMAVTVMTILAWIFLYETLGLATIALLSVAVLFIFRLAQWDKVERSVNWGIFLMYGGAIALGSALHTTGAAQWVAENTLGRLDVPAFVLVILLGAASLLLTEFISNVAVVSVMMPVAIGLAHSNNIPLPVVAFCVALPSGLPYTLPMGTPATAIAYSSGYMTQKDFLRVGPLMALISLVLFSLIACFYWPLLGYDF